MKKYIAVLLVCFSSLALAQTKDLTGERTPSNDSCSAKEYTECEPCMKACIQRANAQRNSSNDGRESIKKTAPSKDKKVNDNI